MENPVSYLRPILGHPLSRGHELRTISRWLGWQARSRLLRGPHVVDYLDCKMLVEQGMTSVTANIYVGLWEFAEIAFALHFLRLGDVFVDAGANYGVFAIPAAKRGADVIAFEPVGANFQRLRENFALNDLEGDLRCVALGDHCGQTAFHVEGAMSRVDAAGEARVPVTTLDRALDGRRADLIKIDVEFHEDAVCRGGAETLTRAHAVILEQHACGEAHRIMTSLGFATWRYDPLSRSITKTDGPLSNAGSLNYLYLREGGFVQERVRGGKPLLINGQAI